MQLTKHHGLGNDFLIALEPDSPLDAELARRLCHRRTGVGADGLIRAERHHGDIVMTLWNSDGSRAELSGNGLRCLGQALVMAGWVDSEFSVVTDAGERRLRHLGTEGSTDRLSVEMGSVSELALPSEVIDQLDGRDHGAYEIGNPHLVVFVSEPEDPAEIGPRLEAGVAGGINVHLVTVESPDRISMSIWERGAGVTEACGSGACVAATAAHRRGWVGPSVTVDMPGGSATVVVGESCVLSGPATWVASVEVPA